jgi:hypothetical protein
MLRGNCNVLPSFRDSQLTLARAGQCGRFRPRPSQPRPEPQLRRQRFRRRPRPSLRPCHAGSARLSADPGPCRQDHTNTNFLSRCGATVRQHSCRKLKHESHSGRAHVPVSPNSPCGSHREPQVQPHDRPTRTGPRGESRQRRQQWKRVVAPVIHEDTQPIPSTARSPRLPYAFVGELRIGTWHFSCGRAVTATLDQ